MKSRVAVTSRSRVTCPDCHYLFNFFFSVWFAVHRYVRVGSTQPMGPIGLVNLNAFSITRIHHASLMKKVLGIDMTVRTLCRYLINQRWKSLCSGKYPTHHYE